MLVSRSKELAKGEKGVDRCAGFLLVWNLALSVGEGVLLWGGRRTYYEKYEM